MGIRRPLRCLVTRQAWSLRKRSTSCLPLPSRSHRSRRSPSRSAFPLQRETFRWRGKMPPFQVCCHDLTCPWRVRIFPVPQPPLSGKVHRSMVGLGWSFLSPEPRSGRKARAISSYLPRFRDRSSPRPRCHSSRFRSRLRRLLRMSSFRSWRSRSMSLAGRPGTVTAWRSTNRSTSH